MKKITLHLTILFLSCFFATSCSNNDNEDEETIIGEWITFERILKTDDAYLNEKFNTLFKLETQNNDITRLFSDNNSDTRVKILITNKETGKEIGKSDGRFSIVGDSLLVEDEIYGGTTKSGFLISGKILITNRELSNKDLNTIGQQLGIGTGIIPANATGTLKTTEIRRISK